MSHKLFYDAESHCVVLQIEGLVNLERIRRIAPEAASFCYELECYRLLNDMSQAVIDISVAGLFSSPKIMDELQVSRQIKRALVVPSEFSGEKAIFLENVTRNRGHNLMVFEDVNLAKQWLLAEDWGAELKGIQPAIDR